MKKVLEKKKRTPVKEVKDRKRGRLQKAKRNPMWVKALQGKGAISQEFAQAYKMGRYVTVVDSPADELLPHKIVIKSNKTSLVSSRIPKAIESLMPVGTPFAIFPGGSELEWWVMDMRHYTDPYNYLRAVLSSLLKDGDMEIDRALFLKFLENPAMIDITQDEESGKVKISVGE